MRPSGARTAVGPIQARAVASHRGRHRLICGGRSRAGVARPDGRRAKAALSATTPLTDLLRWRRHGWAIDTFASQPAAGRADPCDLKRRECVESRIDTFTLAFGTLFLRSTELRRPAEDHRGDHGTAGDREDPHAPGSAGPGAAACASASVTAASGLRPSSQHVSGGPVTRAAETGCARASWSRGSGPHCAGKPEGGRYE